MEDGNFRHLGGITRWNSQFSIHTWTFLAIISVASQLFLCLIWTSLWLRIDAYNTLVSKIRVKLLKSPEIQIPTPNTSLFGFANTFMISTPCSLHSQVTDSLILSWIGVWVYLIWSFANLSCGFLAVTVEKWYRFKAASKFLCDWNQTSPLTSADRPKIIIIIIIKSIVEFHSRIGAVFPPQRNMKKRTTHLRHDVYFRNLLLGKAMMPRWHHHSFRFRFLGWWNLQCTPSGTQLSKNLPRPAAVADGLRAAAGRRRSSSTVRALGKRAEEVGGCSAVLLDNCVRVSIVHCTFQ